MSHDKDTYDNYRPQRARVAQSEWRLNEGRIEDMVRQVWDHDEWVDFTGASRDFTSWEKRRVIWRPR